MALVDATMQALAVLMAFLLGWLTSFGLYHLFSGFAGLPGRKPPRRPAGAASRVDEPHVTFLVTAYRDPENVAPCLRALLALDHPPERLHVVIVADEDEEGTAEALRGVLVRPGARVVRNREGDEVIYSGRVTGIIQTGPRAGRGKPRALQNGLRYARRDGFVGIMDVDHLLAENFLVETLPHFEEDPKLGIVQARRTPKIVESGWLETWDFFEQNVGQVQSLVSRDRVGGASFYGSAGIIRADLLADIGWENSLAEDTLVSYDVRERGYRVKFVTTTCSYEDHVDRLRYFVRQRRRWSAGHMQVYYAKVLKLVGSAELPLRERLEAIYHLHYYFVAVVLLQYWLLRATHYWFSRPGMALAGVLAASAVAGLGAVAFERRLGSSSGAQRNGFVVGTALAFALLSVFVPFARPPASPLPFPWALDVALFLSPLTQMACGYLNPDVRPPVAHPLDHVRRWAIVLALAVPMLVINLYATLTGVLVSVQEPDAAWIKTTRSETAQTAY